MKKEYIQDTVIVFDPDTFKPYWCSPGNTKGNCKGSILKNTKKVVEMVFVNTKKKSQVIFNGKDFLVNVDFF